MELGIFGGNVDLITDTHQNYIYKNKNVNSALMKTYRNTMQWWYMTVTVCSK